MGRVINEFWYKFRKAGLGALIVFGVIAVLGVVSNTPQAGFAAVIFGFATFFGLLLR